MDPVARADEIFVVKPRLDRDQAARKLSKRSALSWLLPTRFDKVELCYLPHYQFKVIVQEKKKDHEVLAAVDAVLGHFAFWAPTGLQLEAGAGLSFELPFLLTIEEARVKLREQYRWVLISRSLRGGRRFQTKDVQFEGRVYYPFWTGYFRKRGHWNYEVLDAVSGQKQGGKVRDALLAAFVRTDAPSP